MSKALWACSLCGEDFTRRSSAERHRNNVHQGRSDLVRYVEYLAGRASGLYSTPIDPPRLARRGKPPFGKTSKIDGRWQIFTTSNQSKNDRGNPLDDIIPNVEKFLHLRTLMNQLSNYSIPLYLPVKCAPMNIPKAVAFRGVSCDTCMSSTIIPIFSFDRLDSAVKKDHTCNSQALRSDISDFRALLHKLLSYLSGLVDQATFS
jgi:hypothetical protein